MKKELCVSIRLYLEIIIELDYSLNNLVLLA